MIGSGVSDTTNAERRTTSEMETLPQQAAANLYEHPLGRNFPTKKCAAIFWWAAARRRLAIPPWGLSIRFLLLLLLSSVIASHIHNPLAAYRLRLLLILLPLELAV